MNDTGTGAGVAWGMLLSLTWLGGITAVLFAGSPGWVLAIPLVVTFVWIGTGAYRLGAA